jgi:hypothetical protein
MKKSEFKKSIQEEILDILEAASAEDVKNQQDFNAELAKTAKLSSDLTENINPEVHRLINGFIRKMADKYDYSLQDAVYAIMQVLRSQNYEGVNEANDSDKFQDDGYVDKKDVDSTSDVYTHDDPESMAFEQIEDEDEDKEPTTSQLKGDSVSNLAIKLQQTTKEMKQVVKKWKNTDGSEKEKLMNRLKVLNKIKKEVEGLL